MPERFDNWPVLMAIALDEASKKPFEWGTHDCVLFAGDIVKAITGNDPFDEFRNRYSDEIGAARTIKEVSPDGLEAALTRVLGDPAKPTQARRGDIVAVASPYQYFDVATGICDGADCLFLKPETGLERVGLLDTVKVWRID